MILFTSITLDAFTYAFHVQRYFEEKRITFLQVQSHIVMYCELHIPNHSHVTLLIFVATKSDILPKYIH